MAKKNTVLKSINLEGDLICIDIFQRPDGSFGFDEFRRDVEDGPGWFSIGFHGHETFNSEDKVFTAAI